MTTHSVRDSRGKTTHRRQVLRVAASLLSAALLSGAAGSAARADTYPSRPITLLVPFAAGGSSDVVMRLLAQKVSENIKQTIVIENRPGGSGNVAAVAIKNGPRDGYLLMMGHTGTHAINASLYSDLKFDPIKDFAPVVALISFNNLLVVPTASPAKSMAELVALGKSKPDGLAYGSQGVGTGGHLLAELLSKQAGVKLVHVPYRGIAPALADTVAGRVDMLFSAYISSSAYIQSGQLRPLALAGAQRHPQFPEVPTTAEAGYPGVVMEQWFGLFAPAGTPEPVVRKLNEEFVKALQSEEAKKALLPLGATILGGTSEEFAARIARDVVALGKVVKESGAKAD